MSKNQKLPPKMHFSNGRYYFVHKKKWHSLSRDLATALEMHAQKLREVELLGQTGSTKLGEHVKKYLAICAKRVKPSTLKGYNYCSRNFEKVFAEFMDLKQIKPKHLSAWKQKFEDKDQKPTWNLHHAFLSGFFAEAVALGWDNLEMTPMALIKKFPVEARGRLISDNEMNLIFQHANEIMRSAMMIADQIGQRLSDIRLLKKDQISDEGVLIAQGKSNGRKRLLIEMTPELKAAIEMAREVCQIVESPYLFHHVNTLKKKVAEPGRPFAYSTWNGYWTDACKKAGVEDAHFHDIRARVATTRDQEGGSAKDLLGHSYQQTTDIYLRAFEIKKVEPVRRKIPVIQGEEETDAN
jgi:integrase